MAQIQLQLQHLDSDGAHLYEPDEQLQLLFGETKDELLPRMESIIDERGLPADARSEYDSEIRSWMKHTLHSKEYYERATFMGLAIEIVGGDWRSFADVLCGEEFLYAAQMILDDIADGQTERHGRSTINAEIGIEKSVAVAQMLASLGYECIRRGSEHADLETQNAVVEGAHSMMHEIFYAQYLDEAFEEKSLPDSTQEEYDHFLSHTTPVDVAYCFEGGAQLGRGNENEINYLHRMGENLGSAIQIRDDFIDYTETDKAGKNTCLDLKCRKKKIPILLAYKYADRDTRDTLINSWRNNELSEREIKNIRHNIFDPIVVEQARKIINSYLEEAIYLLQEIDEENSAKERTYKIISSLDI